MSAPALKRSLCSYITYPSRQAFEWSYGARLCVIYLTINFKITAIIVGVLSGCLHVRGDFVIVLTFGSSCVVCSGEVFLYLGG